MSRRESPAVAPQLARYEPVCAHVAATFATGTH